jgi:RNA polymerase sigma-70 factor (ECF subfamily)
LPPEVDPRVSRAAGGDRAAAESLLRELLPRVRNLVRYLVRGDPEVDDLTQHALIAIVRGLSTYRGDGTFKAWSDRIVVRETMARTKKLRADRTRFFQPGPDLALIPSNDAAPDEYLMRRETVKWLDALPFEQRHAVVLHYVVGMSVPEVASALDVPFDTAKSRIRLGMQKLRDEKKRREDE